MSNFRLMAFLLAVPLLLAVGCKKKDNTNPDPEPNVPEEKYLGTWNGTNQKVEIYMGGMPIQNEDIDLEEGEFVLIVKDNNTLELTFTEPTAEEPTTQTLTYEKISNYSIKFDIQIEMADIIMGAVLNIDQDDHEKAMLNVDEKDIEVQPGMVVDVKMDVTLEK